MEKIKNFLKLNISSNILYLLGIFAVILFLYFATGYHWYSVLVDYGREYLISLEMLKGNVPYKDITLIYFPLSFYLNTFIFKFFGDSINAFTIVQTVLASIILVVWYNLCKEFIDKRDSFLLTVFILITCFFSITLFSYIHTYSYSRLYGLYASWICVYALIKLLKTDKLIYACIGAVACGFAFACKLEYYITVIVFLAGLCLYKRLNIKEYLKLFLCFLIFPVITIGTLYVQGVTFDEIKNAITYGIAFATTPAMSDFLNFNGLYPFHFVKNFPAIVQATTLLLMILFLSFIIQKRRTAIILSGLAILIVAGFYSYDNCDRFWLILPYVVFAALCLMIKNKEFNNNKPLFYLVLASVLLSQREFFSLAMNVYGVFSFPLLILSLITMAKYYLPKEIFNVKIKNWVTYSLIVFICLYSYKLYDDRKLTNTPIITPKGVIYTDDLLASAVQKTIDYIETRIPKEASLLVLPEGTTLNYLTGRKVDMHCFMMDRLYHDAYGEKQAASIIYKSNSDYIILVHGFKVGDFKYPNLYRDRYSSLSSLYIHQHYKLETKIANAGGEIRILKKLKTPPPRHKRPPRKFK